MESFEELQNQPKFENVAGLYINNPKKTSYLMFLANEKAASEKEFLSEIYHDFTLMTSLIKDYTLGNYRNISLRTIIIFLYIIIDFLRPRKKLLDRIPGVKLIRQFGLISLGIKSFRKDLQEYELWRNQHRVIEV